MKHAIKRVLAFGLNCPYESGSLEHQIAMSLKVYSSRGEFDGSLESAIECLELAGYEVES